MKINIIVEVMDHAYIKVLSIFVLMAGYILDALGQSEYFYLAFVVVSLVIIIAYIDVCKIKKIYEQDVLPVPIVINIDSNNSAKYILNNLFLEIEKKNEFQNLKQNLKKYKNIVEDDLLFTYSEIFTINQDLLVFFK